MWKKGTKQELAEMARNAGNQTDEERGQAAGEHAREYVEAMKIRYKAQAEGRELDGPPPIYKGAVRSQPPI